MSDQRDVTQTRRHPAARAAESLCGLLVLVLVAMPLLLAPLGSDDAKEFVFRTERRPAADWPKTQHITSLIDAAFWSQAADAMRDRVAFRGAYIEAKNVIDQRVFAQRSFGQVDLGLDGWLYFRPSFGERFESVEAVDHAIDTFEAFLGSPDRGPARFVFVLAPDKHTIHPEHLRGASRVEVSRWNDERERLHSRVADLEGPEVIDAWRLYRAERERLGHDVYYPLDTHHNRHAHRALMKAVLERVGPGVFSDDDFVEVAPMLRGGDLIALSGLPIERIEVPMLHLTRDSDRPSTTPERDAMFGVKVQKLASPESPGGRVVAGRTLLVHDSFGQQMRWVLGTYFEDLTMVREASVSADELLDATHAYDTVIVELVERHASERMPRLFDPAWTPGQTRAPDPLDDQTDNAAGDAEVNGAANGA